MASEAPACRALLTQATKLYPGRSTLSDGIMASPAHTAASPTSDHELGNAVDLTDDPGSGCDAHAFVRWLVKQGDARVKYCISNSQIWSAERAKEGWRPYSGDNKHNKHAHVSIYAAYRNDTSPWFKENFMLDADAKRQIQAMLDQSEAQIMAAVRVEIGKAVQAITGGVRTRDAAGNVLDTDPNNVSNADLLTSQERKA